jgi:RNA polymerase sigma factor (sigma-70 family)
MKDVVMSSGCQPAIVVELEPTSPHPLDDAEESRTAFGQIWQQQKSHLYARCLYWMAGDVEQAGDVLSQLAMKILEDSTAWVGSVDNHTAWLTRLARNMCIDMRRQQRSYGRAMEQMASVVDAFGGATIEEHPEKEWLRAELGQQILSSMEALPPALREPSKLRFLEHMHHEEIAAELGLSNETVRKRIQQARTILRRSLECYLCEGLPASALRGDLP